MVPKLSVIVPIYGVEKYIERCARSLFGQTLDDIEYIFVNDCTKDSSIKVLQTVINDYSNIKNQIKILHHPENKGLSQARKTGIDAATGEYVVHCDSDDWVDSKMYETLYTYAKEGNFDMVWCDYYRSDGIVHKCVRQNSETTPLCVIKRFLNSQLIASLCNRLYRRELHEIDNFIYPTANMTEDFVISLQITLASKNIGYIPQPLYYYYTNSQSISKTNNYQIVLSNLDGIIKNNEIILEILSRYGLTKQLERLIEYKKFSCRCVLNPLLLDKVIKKKWVNTYPEINKTIMSNPYLSTENKIKTFFLLYRLDYMYYFIHKLHFLRRKYFSKI